MASVESMRSREPERGPSLPQVDIRLSAPDRDDWQIELSNVFPNERSVEQVLRRTTFPLGRIPAFANSTALEVWGDILLELDRGVIPAGNYQLLHAAIRPYPANAVFQQLAETYLQAGPVDGNGHDQAGQQQGAQQQGETPLGQAEPAQDGERTARAAEPLMCHVIIRASTEQDREHAVAALRDLDLDPVEQWSTAHAVSYRVNSGSQAEVRAHLEASDFGWTVVPPGVRDYLLNSLYVEGPDGRQFRITDAPAQQTVGNIAAEVVDQYGGDLPDSTARPTVVDHVGADGQGRRLDPTSTLDESGIHDGDTMRVGFQARAAAVNPVDRQDALHRVHNQILDFRDAQDEDAEFEVQANSTLLPTEYELEFTQPSFGPPAAPGALPTDIDRHQVLIQLPSDFPESPPLVFWLTPIFHPNVFPTYDSEETRTREGQMKMGLVCLGALSESYLPSLHFGALCQLLMDIAAFRNYSVYKPSGTIEAGGGVRLMADYFDKNAAAWVLSEDGQRRIDKKHGAALVELPRERPYRNVIERVSE